jgi:hypothetical protein
MNDIPEHGGPIGTSKIASMLACLTSVACITAAGADPHALDGRSVTKDTGPNAVTGAGYPVVAGGGSGPSLAMNVYTDGTNVEIDGDIAARGGDITHQNADGETRVLITDGGLGSDAGFIRTDGPNGTNVLITNVSGFPDYGFVGVYDAHTTQAFMSVDTSGDGNVSSDYAHLVPQTSPPPGGASNGSLYYDSSHALCARVNGAWLRIAGSGTCS